MYRNCYAIGGMHCCIDSPTQAFVRESLRSTSMQTSLRKSEKPSEDASVGLPSQESQTGLGRTSTGQCQSLQAPRADPSRQAGGKRARPSIAEAIIQPVDKAVGVSRAKESQKGAKQSTGQACKATQQLRPIVPMKNAPTMSRGESRIKQKAGSVSPGAAKGKHPSRTASAAAVSTDTKAKPAETVQPQKMGSSAEVEIDGDEVLLDDELHIEPTLPDASLSGRSCSQEDGRHRLKELDIDWCGNAQKGFALPPAQRQTRASLRIPQGEP